MQKLPAFGLFQPWQNFPHDLREGHKVLFSEEKLPGFTHRLRGFSSLVSGFHTFISQFLTANSKFSSNFVHCLYEAKLHITVLLFEKFSILLSLTLGHVSISSLFWDQVM